MPHVYRSYGPDPLAPVRAFLAIPAYAGMPSRFAFSLWHCQYDLMNAGISADLCILEEHCHVDDSRNCLVREFLESDCTDLVFLDADIGWLKDNLSKLLSVDRDVVGGIYPLKQDNADFPIDPIPGDLYADEDGCVEVIGIPTGFMRIRRHVLQKLYDAAPKFLGRQDQEGRLPIGLIFERAMVGNVRLGGDYNFCRKAREAGYKIHCIPEMDFAHVGSKTWHGNLGDHWKEKHGIHEAEFNAVIDSIKAGTETEEDIAHLCKLWGNIPWAAGHGLVKDWIERARTATGDVLECGSGITTLVAAAANPNIKVWALDHDLEWGSKTRAYAQKYKLDNIEVCYAPLNDRWYTVPDKLPKTFGLALVDGPPRDIGDRIRIKDSGIDLSGAVVLWDDMDQSLMKKWVNEFAEENHSTANFVEHKSKNYAVVS